MYKVDFDDGYVKEAYVYDKHIASLFVSGKSEAGTNSALLYDANSNTHYMLTTDVGKAMYQSLTGIAKSKYEIVGVVLYQLQYAIFDATREEHAFTAAMPLFCYPINFYKHIVDTNIINSIEEKLAIAWIEKGTKNRVKKLKELFKNDKGVIRQIKVVEDLIKEYGKDIVYDLYSNKGKVVGEQYVDYMQDDDGNIVLIDPIYHTDLIRRRP